MLMKIKTSFKKRDLLEELDKILLDVECAAQELSTLTIKVQAEPPILDDISPSFDDLGDTASDIRKATRMMTAMTRRQTRPLKPEPQRIRPLNQSLRARKQ